MSNFFSIYLNQFTYSGLIAVLVGTGIGLPFPESIILILGGFMAYTGRTDLYYTISACYLGVMAGDILSYQMGRKWGDSIINKTTLNGWLTTEKWNRVKEHFTRHENKTIFISRFIPGIRVAAHLMAGVLKVRAIKFLFLNSLAAMINVPLTIYLGYVFGNKIERALYFTKGMTLLFLTVVFTGAGAGITYYFVKHKRAQ
jgi:membrane protein DedA with SNARE-associated domain